MKDAKGHGSNARGASDARNSYGSPMTPRLARNDAIRAANKAKGAQPSPYAPITTQRMSGTAPSTDRAAASALSQGAPPSKAGPAVHGSMAKFVSDMCSAIRAAMGETGLRKVVAA